MTEYCTIPPGCPMCQEDKATFDSDDYPTLDDIFDNIESDETGLH